MQPGQGGGGYTWGRERRLHRRSDFAAARERGISRAHPLLVLQTVLNSLPYSRFGLVVSRRVDLRAVGRNRVRRRLREIVRQSPVRAGWDVVLVARPAAAGAAFGELRQAVWELERRAGLVDTAGVSAPRTTEKQVGTTEV